MTGSAQGLVRALDTSATQAAIRESFARLDPEMVGALAAMTLADLLELRCFDLFGEAAFGVAPSPIGRAGIAREGFDPREGERLISLAKSVFANNVAQLCRFAQTGEIPQLWAAGWWDAPREGVEAVQHTAAVLLQSLFVRPLGQPGGYEDGWWVDPGPIDPSSHSWELLAVLHLTRARMLERTGSPGYTLPIARPRANGNGHEGARC